MFHLHCFFFFVSLLYDFLGFVLCLVFPAETEILTFKAMYFSVLVMENDI